MDINVLGQPLLPAGMTWPLAAAALLILVAFSVGTGLLIRRGVRAVNRSVERRAWTGRRVLIVVAIVAALGVAAIGGARSFGAVSAKFHSPLVPLVADGMIIACTALRLAALTRGWRMPGALLTTYMFIGGTVWLNIDTATGIADALAHALAPLAYAVLIEMLAHMLRLHMKLAQPSRAKLSALTWVTSPVITTRVWLHLARTGTDDPLEARALVQQVVRMASRLESVCPSRRLWPLDSARGARTAALQTIRDGLLSAAELAALLPAAGRLTAGELLALVDSAALGLTGPVGRSVEDQPTCSTAPATTPAAAPVWLVAYLLGALRTAPVHSHDRTEDPAPVQERRQGGAGAPERTQRRTNEPSQTAPRNSGAERTDEEILAELHRLSDAEHGGGPLSQRQIVAATRVGFSRAKRLVALAGWDTPAPSNLPDPDSDEPPTSAETRGQLSLVSEAAATHPEAAHDSTTHERETSSSR